ncbi:MAG: SDR family oxidoreductase [Halobacteriovoraceae bacterium]|nr:SDR family oxidoreductase [Halobacteriovoraceae bacterium]
MNYSEVQHKISQEEKTWLITGVAGFIGSNLAEALISLGQKVIGFDNLSTGLRKNIQELQELGKNKFVFLEGDLANFEDVFKATEGVDYILHQGALGSVPRSLKEPLRYEEANIRGTNNLLEAMRLQNIKRIVFASSSSVYGDNQELPKIENQVGDPLSPYALSKKINEQMAEVYAKCYGIEYIGLRYFNVFGKRQDPDSTYAAVIPRWIKAMLHSEPLAIFGDGETSRDFCYIENVIQMNLLASCTQNEKALNQIFNCAFSQKTSLNELYQLIKTNLLEIDPSLEINAPEYKDFRPGDIRHSLASLDKAKRLLDYHPEFSLAEGLKKALPWYYKNLK